MEAVQVIKVVFKLKLAVEFGEARSSNPTRAPEPGALRELSTLQGIGAEVPH